MIKLPAMSSARLHSWPTYEIGGRARYMPIAAALSSTFDSDAHTAAYSVPSIERRLSREAINRLPDGVPMVAAIFDVDGHGESKMDEWRAEEREKLSVLRVIHPDPYVYDTRGGYRIVYLIDPIILRTQDDAIDWSVRYARWVAHLRNRFGIFADVSCVDWQRLYRLPHATRGEGGPEQRGTIGDVSKIGRWAPVLSHEDIALACHLRPRREATKPATPSPASYVGDGVLAQAFAARGWLGREINRGVWTVRCPWHSHHSIGAEYDGSTVLYAADGGSDLGALHCKHSHCEGRRIAEVLSEFTPQELHRARLAAGVVRAA